MKNKISKNQSFLKKILIKIIRKIGYEFVDQSNLTLSNKGLYIKENLSEAGIKSVVIPLGETTITRKVKSLTIIIRSYTFGDKETNQVMLDQNKQRIFEFPKSEYTFRTINSVIKSCEYAKKFFKDIKFKIIISDDRSNSENLNKIDKILSQTTLDSEIINIKKDEFNREIQSIDENGKEISSNMISNMRNIYKSLEIAKSENSDLFYFLEDDYVHEKIAISEMLFTYEKISSQLNKELFLCPADYPYLYSNIDKTSVFFGNQRHWRQINETLITFLTSKEMIVKYIDQMKEMSTKRHHPMEKKLHEIYEKETCLSPIPSISMHCTNINSIYGLPPNFNWKKVWEENEFKF